MAGNCSIFDGGGPFAYGDCILDLAQRTPLHAGVPGTADRAPGSKMLQQFLFSTPRAWMNRLR